MYWLQFCKHPGIFFYCAKPLGLGYLFERSSFICIYNCLQELLAIQQQGPRSIGFFGTRNMGFMHQELIEILSYALVITVRCYDINLIYFISICLLGILILEIYLILGLTVDYVSKFFWGCHLPEMQHDFFSCRKTIFIHQVHLGLMQLL